jgi:hypothetical protein
LGLNNSEVSAVNVQAAGLSLAVENVGPLTAPGFSATYIVARLPEGIPAGNWPLTVTVRGVASSNSPLIAIAGP